MDAFEAAGRNEKLESIVEVRAREEAQDALEAEMAAMGELPADSPYADRETFTPGYVVELGLRDGLQGPGWTDVRRRLALEVMRQRGLRGEARRADEKRAAEMAALRPGPQYVQPPRPHVVKPAPARKMTLAELPVATAYEVKRGGRVYLGGGFAEIRTGKVIQRSSYSVDDLAAMLAFGIVLEPEGRVPPEQVVREVGADGVRVAVLMVHLTPDIDAGDFLDRLEQAATQIAIDTWGIPGPTSADMLAPPDAEIVDGAVVEAGTATSPAEATAPPETSAPAEVETSAPTEAESGYQDLLDGGVTEERISAALESGSAEVAAGGRRGRRGRGA